VLKLIYHTAVFGPIDFEYDRPIIRVGRSEDNDLVLRHPSVEPHHCFLLFRDEKVFCLPPSEVPPSPAELPHLTGQEFGSGDCLWIGELQFTLAHSSTTVALHVLRQQDAILEAVNGETSEAAPTDQTRFFCPQCQKFIPEAAVKKVGLVGQPKRNLCPKCSRLLEMQEETRKAPEKQAEKKGLHRLLVKYQSRLQGRER
jgi:hypothetical protein